MTDVPPFAPEWLALREDADARARSREPVGLIGDRGRVVADLGCGTGSLGRWLSPRLPSPQHWVLFDRDPRLLSVAERSVPGATTEARRHDLAALRSADLSGCTLVVASALLDVLTRPAVDTLVGAVADAGCPALFSLTVAGRVELSPADPLDGAVARAFDAHQRRGGLMGPDAVGAARASFAERGVATRTFPSPWRLGGEDGALLAAWLRGWVGAALEQDPDLPADAYLERRLEECSRGALFAIVHHTDLWADPAGDDR
ncbi:class I SAM-dependent methyltransferase [Nocardiopsis sp. NRRL B-16309]|uniref:methyltransferase domain-containing protein n=1 Tax=Nocardiopsis sp. NRRL B-16309 TaxID=1519494 RepID=UPI0006AE59BE|nr:class I SAM-dependent methyltransferase [Nocardiopsis sp. NRRL B-16309]KOX15629.1 trans-aconitate methyltransferase [Nocardiopsis sp. NRRL B-16309]